MTLPDEWMSEVVHANGCDLHCYRSGDGQPVVMAHGLYDDARRWIPLADDLADHYQVVTYDARGHGRSAAPETGYSLDDRVGDLRAVIQNMGLEDPILLGHSMGAATAAWTAAKHPDIPRGLVLEDPEGLHREPDMPPEERASIVRERVNAAANKTVEELVEEHYSGVGGEHARRLATASQACSPYIAEIARHGYPSPLDEVFPEISSPTLVLRSDAAVEERARDLDAAESLPNGRLIHIPNASHYIFQDEYDAAYVELRTFLSRI